MFSTLPDRYEPGVHAEYGIHFAGLNTDYFDYLGRKRVDVAHVCFRRRLGRENGSAKLYLYRENVDANEALVDEILADFQIQAVPLFD